MYLPFKQPGEQISAADWNALVRLASREVRGDNVLVDSHGWTLLPLPSRSVGSGAIGLFARITSKVGSSAPYRYAAAEAEMDIDGEWETVVDGAVYNNVFVLDEAGDGGEYVGPLSVGDPVLVCAAPGGVDAWVAIRAAWRGTYG